MLVFLLMRMSSQQCLDDVGSDYDGVVLAYSEIGMGLD